MISTLASFAVWALLGATVIVVGWDEPLRYRFQDPAKIAAEEKALIPPPPPAATPRPMPSTATMLDPAPRPGGNRSPSLNRLDQGSASHPRRP